MACDVERHFVVLETIVMIYRTQKVSNSIHSVGNKHKERNLYTVMSNNALNKMGVYLTFKSHSLLKQLIFSQLYVHHVM